MKVNALVKLYEVKFLKKTEEGYFEEIDNVFDSDTNKVLKSANEYAKEKGYSDDDNIIKTQVIISRVEKEVEL